MDTIIFLVGLFGVVVTQSVSEEASLRFYYSSLENYTEIPLRDVGKIFQTNWYDSGKGTVVFAHGFTGTPTGPAVTNVIGAYIKDSNYNIALLNWEKLAAVDKQSVSDSYLKWAAPNARKLGITFADVLLDMVSEGLNLSNTHLVGHSLGAHIFGIAGSELARRGTILTWITGLDPARIGFENKASSWRLDADSARFVDIVHTDPNKYGYKGSHGTVDFWPNYNGIGPALQPGCDVRRQPKFSWDDLCNHNRCWQLWIDTLKHPGSLLGSYAKNYRQWKKYSPEERNATTLALGSYNGNAQHGDYFLLTAATSPYGIF